MYCMSLYLIVYIVITRYVTVPDATRYVTVPDATFSLCFTMRIRVLANIHFTYSPCTKKGTESSNLYLGYQLLKKFETGINVKLITPSFCGKFLCTMYVCHIFYIYILIALANPKLFGQAKKH